jgi:hypothetical protein
MIAGIAAAVLFVAMFLSWYSIGGAVEDEVDAQIQRLEDQGLPQEAIDQARAQADAAIDAAPDTSANAWQAFDIIDLILMLTILAAVAMVAIAATSTQVNLPVAMSALVAGLGILATLCVLYRLIDPPADGIDRSFGIFIGLIAAGGIAYGGWRAMEEEGTSFGDQADRVQSPGPGAGAPPPAAPPPAAPPPPPADPPPSQQPPQGPAA